MSGSSAEQELEALRARVAQLEAERAAEHAAAARAVAAAQERAYWLDRWHVDLNALMERRALLRALDAAKAVRGPVRRARKLSRTVRGR